MICFQIQKLFVIFVLILTNCLKDVNGNVFTLIRELLQNNVAGEPIVHKTSEWEFDPEISEKRRPAFYEENGFRANKFIQKIGLGIDGKSQERFVSQSIRDRGRLNGEHYINFP